MTKKINKLLIANINKNYDSISRVGFDSNKVKIKTICYPVIL